MSGQFTITWLDGGRPPRAPSNPRYPDGMDADLTDGKTPACIVKPPYPTGHRNIGGWLIECTHCGLRLAITAGSRPDDPRSVKVACKTSTGTKH